MQRLIDTRGARDEREGDGIVTRILEGLTLAVLIAVWLAWWVATPAYAGEHGDTAAAALGGAMFGIFILGVLLLIVRLARPIRRPPHFGEGP